MLKVSKNVPKVFKNEPKLRKIGNIWYYVHFEKKKYVKNYKVGVFLNKKRHDKLLSVEENWNKT